MARYIKTEDAIPYLTKYIPSVEAVEYSEYEKVKIERDISVQQIYDLGNSVSKAIEEIKKLPKDYGSSNLVNGAIDDVLKILERCLGE